MKAAAYCRFSSDNHRDESIDAQLRAIKEYAEKIILKLSKYMLMKLNRQLRMTEHNFFK
jgi:hypothetical protein